MKIIFYCLICVCCSVCAQNIDENALFSDSELIIEEKSDTQISAHDLIDIKSVSFSGRLLTRGIYFMNRDWMKGEGDWDSNLFENYSEADFFIDARLQKGIKGFVNLFIGSFAGDNDNEQESDSKYLEKLIKEFILDINIDKKIYFRIGKQVLKWGRTYFWNPTDLINIEKQDFFYLSKYREGIFGTKVHIPFGRQKNVYMFLDFTETTNLDEIAYALKYEFILKKSELAFSLWGKNNTGYAIGMDFSTRLLDLDIKGELCWHMDKNISYVRLYQDEAFIVQETDQKNLKISLSFLKTFDWELSERIQLNYEVFYNQNGYEENIFSDLPARTLLMNNDLYDPNYHGIWYHAFFVSINKFPVSEMIFNLNGILNADDGSFVLITGIDYEPVDAFNLRLNLNIYGGTNDGEYTFEGYGSGIDMSASIEF